MEKESNCQSKPAQESMANSPPLVSEEPQTSNGALQQPNDQIEAKPLCCDSKVSEENVQSPPFENENPSSKKVLEDDGKMAHSDVGDSKRKEVLSSEVMEKENFPKEASTEQARNTVGAAMLNAEENKDVTPKKDCEQSTTDCTKSLQKRIKKHNRIFSSPKKHIKALKSLLASDLTYPSLFHNKIKVDGHRLIKHQNCKTFF